ncbi:hypothetical protein LOAG_13085 [Loa loa]|uniref:Uncharacterized protein n=1 Tax=Loa loa TaxID=7209 RepID=A0A1S0TK55_LOALO|nr:hypothetical protein LOAG_13085 [Loa loa]EFO15425.1 hypothetical protein LOAG_13085 [Loa loa]
MIKNDQNPGAMMLEAFHPRSRRPSGTTPTIYGICGRQFDNTERMAHSCFEDAQAGR